MSVKASKLVALSSAAASARRITSATLSRVADDGTVLVRSDAGKTNEQVVRVLRGTVNADELEPGVSVLLLQPDDETSTPVLVGVLADRVELVPTAAPRMERISGRSVEVVASEELRLICGSSSVVLMRDGRIVLRGARITSRASQSNRVKGGTVQIN